MTGRPSVVSRLSFRKRFLFASCICLASALGAVGIAEIIVRQRYAPWTMRSPVVDLRPAGSYYRSHPLLGYTPTPGEFTVTLPGPYSFTTTHLPDGTRITHPLVTYPRTLSKELWIFGCSFTGGWSLNDKETYPWLIQERLPGYEVVNFGANGYSTVQSFLQLREALASGRKPEVAVLSYADFHDMRNTGTGAWMKALLTVGGGSYGSLLFPYMRFSTQDHAELIQARLEYRAFPFARWSALANALDDRYNPALRDRYDSHRITEIVIDEFANLCKANGIPFVLAGIYPDPVTSEALDHFHRKGILTVDISVDPTKSENSNMPYDHHPSAFANRQFAAKLADFLQRMNLVEDLNAPETARQ
jgi:hypothetical protein